MSDRWAVFEGDSRRVLRELDDECVQCIVSSPPYWGLRNYGPDAQIGLEATPDRYVRELVRVFREARRVLARDGVLWINLDDVYTEGRSGGIGKTSITSQRNQLASREAQRAHGIGRKVRGLPAKNLIGLPWRLALALQKDGWWLRCDCIWEKESPNPESATDRPTRSHEYLFLLSKSARYAYDAAAVAELGSPETRPQHRREGGMRNKRSVFRTKGGRHSGDHNATFPTWLVEPLILAGCAPGKTVLDPFAGSGTTGEVALRLGRNFVGVDVVPKNCAGMRDRFERVLEGRGEYAPADAAALGRPTQIGLFAR